MARRAFSEGAKPTFDVFAKLKDSGHAPWACAAHCRQLGFGAPFSPLAGRYSVRLFEIGPPLTCS